MWTRALLLVLAWCCFPVCYACGGLFHTSSGVITSPNWPRPYGNGLSCRWDINPGINTTIYVALTNNDVEGCYDYIQISLLPDNPPNVWKLCNAQSFLRSFELQENQGIRVFFVSDSSNSRSGFRLLFWNAHLLHVYVPPVPGILNAVSEQFPRYSGWGFPGYSERRSFRHSVYCIPRYGLASSLRPPPRECRHGGHLLQGECICAPGFAGSSCEKACGFDRYGTDCTETCSGTSLGCSNKKFCSQPLGETLMPPFDHDRSSCRCAAGFQGPECDEACSPGRYGADCKEACGFCSEPSVCNPLTGVCSQGCSFGFTPPYCREPLSYLTGGVNVSSVTESSFNGRIFLQPIHLAGTGPERFYELQFKEEQKLEWVSGCLGKLNGSDTYDCSVDGLRPNTTYVVRALLLNEKMEGFTNVRQVVIRTEGQRQLSDAVVSDIRATSLRVSWTSPAPGNSEFFVMYQCEKLLGCPGESCEHVKGTLIVRSKPVVLKDLVPFSSYLIHVSRDGETEMIAATTSSTVPDALVSDLQTTHVTNETAVVRWRPPLVCALLNGPLNNFRWKLLLAMPPGTPASLPNQRSGSTNNLVLMLRDLKPLTKYELRVSIINAVGENPNQWATLLFNTTNTVPDAPRELAVYRLNATTLWVHWKIPLKPSGKIRSYVVTVQGAGAERKEVVAPPSVCPAWLDLICHKVGGLKPHTEYTLVVRAVNEYGDEPGEPIAVRRATVIGVPEAPKNLLLLEAHPRSLAIQWQLPDFINADLRLFEVLVTPLRDEAGGPRREEVKVAEEKPLYEHVITNLDPSTTYKIAVRCGWNGQEAHLHSTTTAAE